MNRPGALRRIPGTFDRFTRSSCRRELHAAGKNRGADWRVGPRIRLTRRLHRALVGDHLAGNHVRVDRQRLVAVRADVHVMASRRERQRLGGRPEFGVVGYFEKGSSFES
jgi:hypothetical protein